MILNTPEMIDISRLKVIAFDLDGTLTQHRTPLDDRNRAVLDKLSQKYRILMVGAGLCARIFNQLQGYPVDILGNYGLQYAKFNRETAGIDVIRDVVLPCDRERAAKNIEILRKEYGFTEFAGNNVEFHPSGCVTFPVLGTAAKQEDKLAFDPDRSKRRKIYAEVCDTFSEYTVFVGGSSSFDMAPAPYNKYYALDLYCKEYGIAHDEAVFVGDDYGEGGNDESVYKSDFGFIKVDDYTKLEDYVKELL